MMGERAIITITALKYGRFWSHAGFVVATQLSLRNHERFVHTTQKFQCDVCGSLKPLKPELEITFYTFRCLKFFYFSLNNNTAKF